MALRTTPTRYRRLSTAITGNAKRRPASRRGDPTSAGSERGRRAARAAGGGSRGRGGGGAPARPRGRPSLGGWGTRTAGGEGGEGGEPGAEGRGPAVAEGEGPRTSAEGGAPVSAEEGGHTARDEGETIRGGLPGGAPP